MTCNVCPTRNQRFPSEADFLAFEKKIQSLVGVGALKSIGRVDNGGPYLSFKYQCTSCNKYWQLTTPDQAFRGEWKEIK
jgi:hypothetical protein